MSSPIKRRPLSPSKSQSSLNPNLPRPPSFPSLISHPTALYNTTKKRSRTHSSASTSTAATTISRREPDSEDNDYFSEEDDDEDEDEDENKPRQRSYFRTPTLSSFKHKNEEHLQDPEDDEGGKSENVLVCLRVKPPKVKSQTSTSVYQFSTQNSTIALTESHPTLVKRGAMIKGNHLTDEYEFRFDALHLSPTPTSTLYQTKIRPVVRSAMKGFNGTVFAYGQTASGKTHTMMGNEEELGVIPLAVRELFDFIHEQNESRSFSLRVSFLEIYNEAFRDLLLCPSSSSSSLPPKLEVHGDDGFVKGLEEKPVSTPGEVLNLLREGELRRKTGMTDWNERSSRSHCVFIVTIESCGKDSTVGVARTSRLNLIDLAGSESATGQDERRKEGSFINKSLLTLGNVIGKLTERNSSNQHIPYRDSKLTRLLQPALSGNSKVAVICTISPDLEQATETLSTLKFAKRVKMVVTKAEIGMHVTGKMMLEERQKEVERLRLTIASEEKAKRERDTALQHAETLKHLNKEAQEEITQKDQLIEQLKLQLAHHSSLILTSSSVEANVRRASGQFGSFNSLLSPQRGPGSGLRIVSEMSGLGIGTPRSGSSKGGRVWLENPEQVLERDTSGVKEAALEFQLEEAKKKLSSLTEKEEEINQLRSHVSQLERSTSLARIDAERTFKASTDRKQLLQSVQRELESTRLELLDAQRNAAESEKKDLEVREAKERLDEVLRELEKIRNDANTSECGIKIELINVRKEEEELKERIKELEKAGKISSRQLSEANSRVEAALKEIESLRRKVEDKEAALSEATRLGKEGEKKLVAAETSVRALERKLAAAKMPDKRDDKIKDLEREITFLKKEISNLTFKQSSSIRQAEEKLSKVEIERDVAIRSGVETRQQVKNLEELLEGTNETEIQLRKENNSTLSRLCQTQEDLRQRDGRVAELEELVQGYERSEKLRNNYASNKRTGAENLRTKLAEVQARSTITPVSAASTSSGSVFSRSTTRTFSGSGPAPMDPVVELQIKNGELSARLAELERQHSSCRLAQSICETTRSPHASSSDEESDRQQKLLEDAAATGEQWRMRYVASEKELNRLQAASDNVPSPSRVALNELNLSTSRAPPPSASRSGDFSLSTSRHGSSKSLSWVSQVPPPLPYSPRNKEKERKLRRETIAKDLERLNQGTGRVDRVKDLLDSPTASPKIASFPSPAPQKAEMKYWTSPMASTSSRR